MGNHVSGTIKPLVWVSALDNCGDNWFHSDLPDYYYEVGRDRNGWWWSGYNTVTTESKDGHATPEAAKAAAQADYEARILAQIDQAPEVQPVAWRYRSIDKPTVWSHLTDHRRTVYGRIGMEEQPLYAQPAPCASKSADTDPQPALSDTDAPQADPTSEAVSGQLLPCPFCDGRAERIEVVEDDGFENIGGSAIECQKCRASSHVEFGRKENLVSAWNRRALPVARAEVSAAMIDAAFNALPADAHGTIGDGEMERVLYAALRAITESRQ